MYRFIGKALVFLCLAALAGGALPLTAAEADKTHKDLVEYILNAQKLGLKEAEIKQNAVKAGWDKGSVDQAFTVVKYLNTTGKAATKPGDSQEQSSLVAGGSLVGGGAALSNSTALPGGYRVGPGDQIGIIVWKEPDASAPETMVRADGKITLPLVKEVAVAGYTPTELEAFLTEKYSTYISGVDVTIIVKAINSRKVYMIGSVRKEGALQLLGPMTVLQAITESGGLNDYAKGKRIYVLRTEKGKQIRLPFDYYAAIRGEHPEQNVLLQPGDSVIIPH
jgi:polysaccharide export outer membrane protein